MAYLGVIRHHPVPGGLLIACGARRVSATFSAAVQRYSAATASAARDRDRRHESAASPRGLRAASAITPPGVVLSHPTIRDHGGVTRGQATQR